MWYLQQDDSGKYFHKHAYICKGFGTPHTSILVHSKCRGRLYHKSFNWDTKLIMNVDYVDTVALLSEVTNISATNSRSYFETF